MITCRSTCCFQGFRSSPASLHGKVGDAEREREREREREKEKGAKLRADLSRLSTPTWGSGCVTQLSSSIFQLIKHLSHSALARPDSSVGCAEKRSQNYCWGFEHSEAVGINCPHRGTDEQAFFSTAQQWIRIDKWIKLIINEQWMNNTVRGGIEGHFVLEEGQMWQYCPLPEV